MLGADFATKILHKHPRTVAAYYKNAMFIIYRNFKINIFRMKFSHTFQALLHAWTQNSVNRICLDLEKKQEHNGIAIDTRNNVRLDFTWIN